MRPSYTDKIRAEMRPVQQGSVVSAGITPGFRELLSVIVSIDKNHMPETANNEARLVFEGLTRVIADRFIMDEAKDDYLVELEELGSSESKALLDVLLNALECEH